MPAARYWRIVGVETYWGGDLELSELALYEGATRVDGSATLTCTAAPIAGALANLQDADTGTTTRFAGADVFLPGFALVWDFGAGVTKDVDSVGLGSTDGQGTFLERGLVQYSADAATWQESFAIKTADFGASTLVKSDQHGGTTRFIGRFDADSLDYSQAAQTVVLQNGAALSADRSKFGTQSLKFAGLNTQASVDLTEPIPATSDFCVEAFAYHVAANMITNLVQMLDTTTNKYVGFRYEYDSFTRFLQISQTDRGQYSSGQSLMPMDTWAHIALTCYGGTLTLYLDGVEKLRGAFVTPGAGVNFNRLVLHPLTMRGAYIDTNSDTTLYPLYFSDVVVTKGRRYEGNFTPPTMQAGQRSGMSGSKSLRQANATPTTISEYPSPAFTINTADPTTFDLTDGGTATIFGTVKRDAEPTDLPVARRVRLYDERGRRFIRETWSDANGDFSFTGISPDGLYTAITYDHLGQFRAVISDALVAEVV